MSNTGPTDASILISYVEDGDAWKVFEKELRPFLPFKAVKWFIKDGRPAEVCVDIAPRFVPEDKLPKLGSADAQSLTGSHQEPYCRLYLISCEDADQYRNSIKPRIARWLQAEQECLIVHVSQKEPGFFSKNVFNLIKTDFGAGRTDRVVQLKLQGYEKNLQLESLDEICRRIRESLSKTGQRIMEDLQKRIRKLDSERVQKGWNFSTFFAIKESLALVYESLAMYEDAYAQYEELETLFLLLDSSNQLKFPSFGGKEYGDDSGSVLNYKRKNYRDRLCDSSISEFDFRMYLFARQAHLLFRLGRPTSVAARAILFIETILKVFARQQLPLHFGRIWAFSAFIDIAEACRANSILKQLSAATVLKDRESDPSIPSELNSMLGDLYYSACQNLWLLGVSYHVVPADTEFIFGPEPHHVEPEFSLGSEAVAEKYDPYVPPIPKREALGGMLAMQGSSALSLATVGSFTPPSAADVAEFNAAADSPMAKASKHRRQPSIIESVSLDDAVSNPEKSQRMLSASTRGAKTPVRSISRVANMHRRQRSADGAINLSAKLAAAAFSDSPSGSPLLTQTPLSSSSHISNDQPSQSSPPSPMDVLPKTASAPNGLMITQSLNPIPQAILPESFPENPSTTSVDANDDSNAELAQSTEIVPVPDSIDISTTGRVATSMEIIPPFLPTKHVESASSAVASPARSGNVDRRSKKSLEPPPPLSTLHPSLSTALVNAAGFDRVFLSVATKAKQALREAGRERSVNRMTLDVAELHFARGRYAEALECFKLCLNKFLIDAWVCETALLFSVECKIVECARQLGFPDEALPALVLLLAAENKAYATSDTFAYFAEEFESSARFSLDESLMLAAQPAFDISVKIDPSSMSITTDQLAMVTAIVQSNFVVPVATDRVVVRLKSKPTPSRPSRELVLEAVDVDISPGMNRIQLSAVPNKGRFRLDSCMIQLGQVVFGQDFTDPLKFPPWQTVTVKPSAITSEIDISTPECLVFDNTQHLQVEIAANKDALRNVTLRGRSTADSSTLQFAHVPVTEVWWRSSPENDLVRVDAITKDNGTISLPDLEPGQVATLYLPCLLSSLPAPIVADSSPRFVSMAPQSWEVEIALDYRNGNREKKSIKKLFDLGFVQPLDVKFYRVPLAPNRFMICISLRSKSSVPLQLSSYDLQPMSDQARVTEDLSALAHVKGTVMRHRELMSLAFIVETENEPTESDFKLTMQLILKDKQITALNRFGLSDEISTHYVLRISPQPTYFNVTVSHSGAGEVASAALFEFVIAPIESSLKLTDQHKSFYYSIDVDSNCWSFVGPARGELPTDHSTIVRAGLVPLRAGPLPLPVLRLEENTPSGFVALASSFVQHSSSQDLFVSNPSKRAIVLMSQRDL